MLWVFVFLWFAGFVACFIVDIVNSVVLSFFCLCCVLLCFDLLCVLSLDVWVFGLDFCVFVFYVLILYGVVCVAGLVDWFVL